MSMTEKVVSLEAWKGRLQPNGKGGAKKTMVNLMLYLKNLSELGASLRWNSLAERVEWNGRPLVESDLVDIRIILEMNQFEPTATDLLPAIIRHAKENATHPVREYLSALKHDGVPRLDTWLSVYLGAQRNAYTEAVGRKTLIAACARAMEPGCKVDTVLVLEGPQGVKKSTAIEALFGADWTAGSVNLFDQHAKMVMSMMGAWCVELAEFIAIQKRDQNTVKGMLTMRSDRVVLPYARFASDHPRQCIFFGTINPGETGYLTDTTGNRRYWPVGVVKADLALIKRDRDQIWAEAFKAYRDQERWWFDEDEERMVQLEVSEREEGDIWDEIFADKLVGIQTTTVAAALQALGMPFDRMDKRSRDRAAASLRRIGFDSRGIGKEKSPDGKRRSVMIFERRDG